VGKEKRETEPAQALLIVTVHLRSLLQLRGELLEGLLVGFGDEVHDEGVGGHGWIFDTLEGKDGGDFVQGCVFV